VCCCSFAVRLQSRKDLDGDDTADTASVAGEKFTLSGFFLEFVVVAHLGRDEVGGKSAFGRDPGVSVTV
jgi:hypothetical protein